MKKAIVFLCCMQCLCLFGMKSKTRSFDYDSHGYEVVESGYVTYEYKDVNIDYCFDAHRLCLLWRMIQLAKPSHFKCKLQKMPKRNSIELPEAFTVRVDGEKEREKFCEFLQDKITRHVNTLIHGEYLEKGVSRIAEHDQKKFAELLRKACKEAKKKYKPDVNCNDYDPESPRRFSPKSYNTRKMGLVSSKSCLAQMVSEFEKLFDD